LQVPTSGAMNPQGLKQSGAWREGLIRGLLPGLISGFGHPGDYLAGRLSRVLRPGIGGGVRKQTEI
jgi:hypothetical protein